MHHGTSIELHGDAPYLYADRGTVDSSPSTYTRQDSAPPMPATVVQLMVEWLSTTRQLLASKFSSPRGREVGLAQARTTRGTPTAPKLDPRSSTWLMPCEEVGGRKWGGGGREVAVSTHGHDRGKGERSLVGGGGGVEGPRERKDSTRDVDVHTHAHIRGKVKVHEDMRGRNGYTSREKVREGVARFSTQRGGRRGGG
jgi:hypothetical protein